MLDQADAERAGSPGLGERGSRGRVCPRLLPAAVCVIAAFACVSVSPAAAATNLISDGQFNGSSIYTPGPGGLSTLGASDASATGLPGWTVTSGDVAWSNGFWPGPSSTDTYAVDLSTGTLEQTVATTPGQVYTLSFALSVNPTCQSPSTPSITANAEVDWDHASIGSNYSVTQTWSSTSMVYLTTTATVTGTGGDTLDFIGLPSSATACGMVIADVSLTSAPPTLKKLTVSPSGAGSGSVSSDDGIIDCFWNGSTTSGTCSHSYPQGEGVQLTATKGSGTFSGWSGGGCSSSPPCVVTLGSDQTVTASFPSGLALTTVTTNAPSPIGIGYLEPSNKLLASVNYFAGQATMSFDTIASNGSVSPYSSASGLSGEAYFATIRTSACQDAFTPGAVYFSDGTAGGIGRISASGAVADPWVTLPGEPNAVTGLAQDLACSFSGDLIVTTAAGDVWRVKAAGKPTEVTSGLNGQNMEGPTTIPNDPRYGPWAGKILVTEESCGCVYSVADDGTVGTWAQWSGPDGGPGAEGVFIVPPNQNFFGVDYGNLAIVGIPAAALASAGIVGDVVVDTEGSPGELWDVRWNSQTQSFDTYNLLATDANQFEGATFSPAGVGTVTTTALKTTKIADASTASPAGPDGYTIKISNPNSSAAPLTSISDTLPSGFSYTAGSSSGATTADPTVSGQTLTWSGAFSVPVGGSITLHFDVTVSNTAGTYYNHATAGSASFTVTPTGQTAPITIGTQYTLTVTKAGTGSGNVSSDPGAISCGSTCSASFVPGTVVSLSATADPGSTFVQWSGACTGTDPNSCQVTMNSDQSVTATFMTLQALATTKTADQGSVGVGLADGYTITVSNPNAQDEPLSSITDSLPSGFSYTKGSSSGVTTDDPSLTGQTLTWSGSFTVPAQSSLILHFDVTVSSSGGTYYNTAGGASAAVAVTGTGPTAPVVVVNGFGLPGTSGAVTALAAAKGAIYVGGSFTSVGGGATVGGGVPGYNDIAEYNGGGWARLGDGLNGEVNAIAVVGNTVYAGGSFTASGSTTIDRLAVWNGHKWSQLGGGVSGTVDGLAYHSGVLYVGGTFTSVGGSTSVGHVAAYTISTKTWSTLGGGVNGPVYAVAWDSQLSQLFVTGSFGKAGSQALGNFASWTGSGWNGWNGGLTGPSGDALAVDPTSGAVYVGGAFSAAGGVSAGNLAELSGGTWSDAGDFTYANGNGVTIRAVAVAGGRVYAEGSFDTIDATINAHALAVKTNGSWSQVGDGINGSGAAAGAVAALVAYGGVRVVVGGDFTYAGPTSVSGDLALNFVGIWSGSAWSTLGQGLLLSNNIAGKTDALLSAGSGVYAGGGFNQAGSTFANSIARWTGGRWVALGSGMAETSAGPAPVVRALAMISGKLYAAGTFASAGGVQANNVAMWDGSAWHALGAGLGGNVYALTVLGGALYAGGDFTSADGQPARGVAEYVPPSATSAGGWNPVGANPFLTTVRALANVSNRYLLIGGGFSQVGSYAFPHGFAVYDTHTTSFPTDTSGYSFPGGVSAGSGGASINAIQVMPNSSNGDVFLGGSFDHADVTQGSSGTAAANLADWQRHPGGTGAATWVIPTGVSGGSISALAESTKATDGTARTPTVYATGNFTLAGTQTVGGLASYAPSTDTWGAVGSGLGLSGTFGGSPDGLALAQNGAAGLYIGGSFLSENGLPAGGIALWPDTQGLAPQQAGARRRALGRKRPVLRTTGAASAGRRRAGSSRR